MGIEIGMDRVRQHLTSWAVTYEGLGLYPHEQKSDLTSWTVRCEGLELYPYEQKSENFSQN